jgi:hypothetical protein
MTFYSFPNRALPHSKNRHVPYKPRFKWGFSWSLSFATIYALFASTIALAQRRTDFPEYHASLWRIIGAYYIASILCGVALAFLYFLFDRRWGAVLLGFMLGYISYLTVAVTMFGVNLFAFVFPLIAGLIVGGGAALVAYDEEHKNDVRAA